MALLQKLGLTLRGLSDTGKPGQTMGAGFIGKTVKTAAMAAGFDPLTATQMAVPSNTVTQVGLPPVYIHSVTRSGGPLPVVDAYVGPSRKKEAPTSLEPLDAGTPSNRRMLAEATRTGTRHLLHHDPHKPTELPRVAPHLRFAAPSEPPPDVAALIPQPTLALAAQQVKFTEELEALFPRRADGAPPPGIGGLRGSILAAMPAERQDERAEDSRGQLFFDRPLMLAQALSIVSLGNVDTADRILKQLRGPLIAPPPPAAGVTAAQQPAAAPAAPSAPTEAEPAEPEPAEPEPAEPEPDEAKQQAWQVRKILARTAPGRDVALKLGGRRVDEPGDPLEERQTRALGTALEISAWQLQQIDPKRRPPGLRALRGAPLEEVRARLARSHRDSLAARAMDAAMEVAENPAVELSKPENAALFAWQQGIRDNKMLEKISGRMAKGVEWIDRTDRGEGDSWKNVFGWKKNPFASFAAGPATTTRMTPAEEIKKLDETVSRAIGALAQQPDAIAAGMSEADAIEVAWKNAALAVWSQRCAPPAGNAGGNTRAARPLECAFDEATAEDVRRRAAGLLHGATLPWRQWQAAQTELARRAITRQSPFTLANLTAWAGPPPPVGPLSEAQQHLARAKSIRDGEEPKPIGTGAEELQNWVRDFISRLRMRNHLQVTHGGRSGLSNTVLPLISAVTVSPDMVATRANSAVVGIGCSTVGGEFRLGVQREIVVQLGAQITGGASVGSSNFGGEISGGGGANIGATVSRFQGIILRTRRQAEKTDASKDGQQQSDGKKKSSKTEQVLIAQRDATGAVEPVGMRAADRTITRNAGVAADVQMIEHPDGPEPDGSCVMVRAVSQDKWKAGLMDTSDFFFQQQQKSKASKTRVTPTAVWEDFASDFASRGGVSVSWQDQQSLTWRGRMLAKVSAMAKVSGWGIGGIFTLTGETTPSVGQNRSDNTGELQRTLIQTGHSGRVTLAQSWGFSWDSSQLDEAGTLNMAGIPAVDPVQQTVTLLDRGVTANFKPVYEHGKLVHDLSLRELEFTDPKKYRDFFQKNRATFDALKGTKNNDEHLRELEKNFVPGQRMVVRWRLTPEAGLALEQLRVRSDMKRAEAEIAAQEERTEVAKACRAEAALLEKAAVDMLLVDDVQLWGISAPENSWDPLGTLVNQDVSTEVSRGPNYVVQAQITRSVLGNRELEYNTAASPDMVDVRKTRADDLVKARDRRAGKQPVTSSQEGDLLEAIDAFNGAFNDNGSAAEVGELINRLEGKINAIDKFNHRPEAIEEEATFRQLTHRFIAAVSARAAIYVEGQSSSFSPEKFEHEYNEAYNELTGFIRSILQYL